jgi:hypothetical protein
MEPLAMPENLSKKEYMNIKLLQQPKKYILYRNKVQQIVYKKGDLF